MQLVEIIKNFPEKFRNNQILVKSSGSELNTLMILKTNHDI